MLEEVADANANTNPRGGANGGKVWSIQGVCGGECSISPAKDDPQWVASFQS